MFVHFYYISNYKPGFQPCLYVFELQSEGIGRTNTLTCMPTKRWNRPAMYSNVSTEVLVVTDLFEVEFLLAGREDQNENCGSSQN